MIGSQDLTGLEATSRSKEYLSEAVLQNFRVAHLNSKNSTIRFHHEIEFLLSNVRPSEKSKDFPIRKKHITDVESLHQGYLIHLSIRAVVTLDSFYESSNPNIEHGGGIQDVIQRDFEGSRAKNSACPQL